MPPVLVHHPITFLDDDDDYDETPTTEIIPYTDPITKLPLTDPVRNKLCRHIYGKASILELIAKNPKFRYMDKVCICIDYFCIVDSFL